MANIISDNTYVKIKISHLLTILGSFISIIAVVLGFFYNMLNNKLEKSNQDMTNKLDKAIYDIHKSTIDEKITMSREDMRKLETSLQNISHELREILLDRYSRGNNTHTPFNNNLSDIEINPNNILRDNL
jgi:hypothetical protein